MHPHVAWHTARVVVMCVHVSRDDFHTAVVYTFTPLLYIIEQSIIQEVRTDGGGSPIYSGVLKISSLGSDGL